MFIRGSLWSCVVCFRICSLLLLASAAPAFAQGEQSGAIRGRLSSSDGLALPGAVITVVSPSLQGDRSAVADVNGVYAIPGPAAGRLHRPRLDAGLRGDAIAASRCRSDRRS